MNESAKKPLTLYGIKNCDSVRKARRWLEEQGIAYQFHDYRSDGLTPELLQSFIVKLGWEAMLNTRGTTWRKLDEAERLAIDNAQAATALMLSQPAIIKRPLLLSAEGAALLGFNTEHYQQFLVGVSS